METETAVPFGAVANALRSRFRKGSCLHPDAPLGCSRVIRAHTLQRNGILSQLVDSSQHVLVAKIREDKLRIWFEVERIGWRDASTFPGFCSNHDSKLFGPIETDPFLGTPHQAFLAGYRSLCHEIFVKEALMGGIPNAMSLLERGRTREQQINARAGGDAYRTNVSFGHNENALYKKSADDVIKSGRYSDWGNAIFEISGDLCIASAGAPTPSFDVAGERIQDLRDYSKMIQLLLIGFVSGPEGSSRNFVIFCWPPSCPGIDQLVRSFIDLPIESLGDALARFMFAQIENTYFSQEWWDSLTQAQQDEVLRLAGIILPESEKRILGEPPLVHWQVAEPVVRWPGA